MRHLDFIAEIVRSGDAGLVIGAQHFAQFRGSMAEYGEILRHALKQQTQYQSL